ncbi:MAG TPA: alpha/beta hydrolase [Caulobacteraceae bacterium]
MALARASQGLAQPTPPAVARALAAYANTKDTARLPDGRSLHLVCMGRGSPVVILSAGGGDWSVDWYKVQPKVAEKTRACAWDRPGFGLSSPTSPPEMADKRTTDLQAALKADGIKGPYIVVGHSLGGLESLLLKDREPRRVVGMVLVDPSYPGQLDALGRTAPSEYAYVISHPDSRIAYDRTCAAGVRAGTIWPGKPDPSGCLSLRRPAVFPPELRDALDKADFQAGPNNYAAYLETDASYDDSDFLRQDFRVAIKLDRNYRDMPLIVLTAGEDYTLPPDAPAEAAAERPKRHAQWLRAHDDLAALSTRGVNRVVSGTPHYIHLYRPQVVIDAIDEVVKEARAAKR